jgi:transposase-like protein
VEDEMPRKKATKRKRYSSEFKANAVKMTFKPDRSVQDVAEELGVSFASLSKWRNEFKSKEDLRASKESLEAKQENDKLKAENKRLKMEVEILKQAAHYFASQK